MPLRPPTLVDCYVQPTTSSTQQHVWRKYFVRLGVLSLLLVDVSSVAQAADTPKLLAMQRVGAACQDEAVRFCSWADSANSGSGPTDPAAPETGKGDPRDVFICLHVYTTSLSPTCRKAVNDAKR